MNPFLTSLLLIFTLQGVFALPSDPVPRPDQWWMDQHSVENTRKSNGSIPIIFYGDSITEGWTGYWGDVVFQQYYAPLGVTNYGIGGDAVEHVHWRLLNGEIDGLNPKLIVLKIGCNNIGPGIDTTAEIAQGIRRVVQLLRNVLPNTKILLLGVLPFWETETFVSVADVNIQIAGLDDGQNIRYLNMFDHFAESWGVIDQSLYDPDKVHLITAGYQKWHDLMDHAFQDMLQS